MRRTKGIVLALAALGEAVEAIPLANRPDAMTPAGENLVGIGLMADIPDQPVAWRVEDIVQCNRQFDDPEATAEMASRFGCCGNHLCPEFGSKARQVSLAQMPQGLRIGSAVKKGCQLVHT